MSDSGVVVDILIAFTVVLAFTLAYNPEGIKIVEK
jgi:hypothetical protein